MNHLPQIITHLSDNDFYKYTMGQMFVHQFHDMKVEWTYKNRDPERKFTREMIDEINDARLLAIANERLAHFDPSTLIPEEKVWERLNITDEDLEAVGEVEFE